MDPRAKLLAIATDKNAWPYPEQAAALLDAYRDQVLTEAAELIVADNDRQLWATKPGKHWAADLLLAARTTQES